MTPPEVHAAVLAVLGDEERLVRLLDLPAGWRVLAFQPYPLRLAIGVLVEGPDLPECAPGMEPAIVTVPDGRVAGPADLLAAPRAET